MRLFCADRAERRLNVSARNNPAGTRIELIEMSDSQAPPAGTLGICLAVDDMGDLIMKWDNGCGLNLIPNVDDFRIVKEASENG